ncbi:hypothetical protein AB0J55_33345 [Amycolatopsis sp. NPDC049688]
MRVTNGGAKRTLAIDPNVTGLILHALDASYRPACSPFTLPL